MSHTKNKWVIVFLIYADFRKNITNSEIDPIALTKQMKAELNSLFKDILMVPIDGNRARMYVVINSIDYRENNEPGTEAKTLFYEIGNPDRRNCNDIVYCEVISRKQGDRSKPNPDSPFQVPDFLTRVMSRIPVHKDEEVFLCTHDHGSAFGIFRETDPGIATGELRRSIQHDLDKYPYLAAFWNRALDEDEDFRRLMSINIKPTSPQLLQIEHNLWGIRPLSNLSNEEYSIFISQKNPSVHIDGLVQMPFFVPALSEENLLLVFDRESNAYEIWGNDFQEVAGSNRIVTATLNGNVREILSNDELAIVLTHWLGEKKVAVLLMMNCWMMNLHTMYSFRETVERLVAPQGNIGTPGYNYKEILRYLFSTKSIFETPDRLAIECVVTSENKRMRRRSIRLRDDHEDVIDRCKIFAMDLQKKKGDKLVLIDHLERFEQFIFGLLSIEDSEEPLVELLLNRENKMGRALQLCVDVRLVSFDFTKEKTIDPNACFVIDIVNWLNILCDLSIGASGYPLDSRILSPGFRLKDEIKDARDDNQLILAASNGSAIYRPERSIVGLAPTGYGLFFPNAKSAQQNLIDNVRKDSLLNDFLVNWREFLKVAYPPRVWGPFFS